MTSLGLADQLREPLLKLPDDRLFAVIDAARDPELARAARADFGLQARTLFHGEVAPYAEDFAPWLVQIPPESPFIEAWVSKLGNSVGILIQTGETPGTLLKSLRGLFVVEDESGQKYFFRFYDPRVLRPFLEVCNDEQADALFGPSRRLFIESDSGTLLVSQRTGAGASKLELTPFRPTGLSNPGPA